MSQSIPSHFLVNNNNSCSNEDQKRNDISFSQQHQLDPLGNLGQQRAIIDQKDMFSFSDYIFPFTTFQQRRRNSATTLLPSSMPFYREQSLGYNNSSKEDNYLLHTIMQEEEDSDEISSSLGLLSRSTKPSSSIWNPTVKEDNDWSFQRYHEYNNNSRRTSMLSTVDDEINDIKERMRRFSLAPPLTSTSNDDPSSLFNIHNQRRHSFTGPTIFYNDTVSELAVKERLSEPPITDNLGKGTRLDSDIFNQKTTLFYVVEFKGGRSDLFYCQKNLNIHVNDLVIVEADRGHDLGKVTMEDITRQQLEEFYSKLKNISTEEKKWFTANEIYIKFIFRLARSDEISLLITKGQDEQKALIICQTKIKQKRLNMQVVDAEYQWDRRKLTFYFIAEKRVDFRELVRELFKLYKTRIWMYSATFLKSSHFTS
ncbi:PSP1 C-terminal conserved region-domain-containing protein [Cokeromyces recurvatus]|uniref:PSP1 C-terminal conserved region-domain-containing protein n=1 Tax=Cokeromyces recurvatus TaxID=90255 RepID=UPI00221E3CB0|nr:PSP1 C-terminal conserved region-domain-containing protein [Cokeromyces recurvatus]KAI7903036.1 PSP1 C-terminal conserved region-domain-containing protein [Cokeromyces recurvatus]